MKKIKLQLNQLMHKHNLSITQLHIKTGIRRATLSELANERRQRIQFEHLEKIVNALNIQDMNELLSIVESDENM